MWMCCLRMFVVRACTVSVPCEGVIAASTCMVSFHRLLPWLSLPATEAEMPHLMASDHGAASEECSVGTSCLCKLGTAMM
jgi:hypothetical protein